MLDQALSFVLDGYTQSSRLLRLSTPIGTDKLLAESVRAEETIGSGYTYRIEALSTDADIPLKSLLGQPALLELLTIAGTDAPRPFHGHITSVELHGSNGGFARYQLTVEPWSAFLGLGRDSRIFQDMNVFDIIDAVCASYEGQGRLTPLRRFDILDRDVYAKRSLTTQYQESDLAFITRLMEEEGLFYFYEHSGDADSPSLGSHTMVIADHNGSFVANAQPVIRYTQPGAVMREDSLDRWRTEMRLQTNAVSLRSWDYRSLSTRRVSASGEGPMLTSDDVPGAYAYTSREHGQRMADRQVEALQASREIHVGAGTVRTLAPATTFTLQGVSQLDAADSDQQRQFLIVRVVHLMHNNLSAETQGSILKMLGQGPLSAALQEETRGSLHAVGSTIADRPLYRNRIDAIPAATPYRSRARTERPVMRGQQSAIVVGPAGAVVHTDRDHRIKLQFHWQRGSASHSRLDHPAAASHTGAPADDTAGTWVRVATPLAPVAGANWGSNALPRVGQEVLVDFIEGNIDRPVVIGALYNGKGADDAQHNAVAQGGGASTGNASAWFPGATGAHAHPAALSGLKSQAMGASQQGAGSYSQLVFDDTPGEPRLALQHHAAPHAGTSELNLGQLRHQTDNQRLAPAGFGAELKTEHSAALRAGQGMLLTSHGGSGAQLDSSEARSQAEASRQLLQQLAETAQKHNATLAGEKAAAEMPAVAAMAHSAEVLGRSASGSDQQDSSGGLGMAAAYREAHLQLSSPAGIAAVTPASAVLAAQGSSSLAAGQDINLAAQANSLHLVAGGISLFTYGKATDAQKPNQETGIRLHAASGRVSSQSQSGPTRLTADKAITVASVARSVNVTAKQHVMLTAQGAHLKLEGGNIELHGPGTMSFKASQKELTGPASATAVLPRLPNGELNLNQSVRHAYAAQYQVLRGEQRLAQQPYLLKLPDGSVHYGLTDAKGKTIKVGTQEPKPVELTLLAKDSWDQENINVWHQEMDRHWD
ncbi:type VI secretion system tip protein VgrG [Duganella sp. BJB1802]|uniref:type VI secretion system Vgr family protein n=1 Tax=Duganella sp. BJB1802 TaxID=2744575 RepID=UPI001594CF73|nr:type VI secretion system Vgr family protein [Duganella sp. BJB1802]NVD74422.1 type VI secretion system tip protein VgrG [Duganella sp. BJB1802]